MLLVHQNTGKENRYGKNFFAVLISTLGRFDRANKKKSVIYTLNLSWKGPKTLKLYQDILFSLWAATLYKPQVLISLAI